MARNYSIDTVGNLFPAVQGEDNSSFFRIATVLKEPVDSDIFQKAVNSVYQRFSFFFVRLRRGVFWNYLEESKDLCVVEQEKDLPCAPIITEKGKSNLVRFLYFQNRITIEVSHIITDGSGCLEMVKAILYSYFLMKNGQFDDEGKVLSLDEIPTIKDYESSFSRYGTGIKQKTKKIRSKKSYRIRGVSLHERGSHVVTGLASIERIKAASKKYNTTITGFLCAVLMFSIYSSRIKYEKNKKPLVIAVPVNLRNLFPSNTLKNFFAVPNIHYTFTQTTTFDEVITSINEQMKNLFSKESLQSEIDRYLSFGGSSVASVVPLSLKDIFIKLGFSLFGEAKKTLTLTNMGAVALPSKMIDEIEHFEVVLYPTKLSPMNGAIVSFQDKMAISFSLAIVETDILRSFFWLLQEYIESNVTVYSTIRGDTHGL